METFKDPYFISDTHFYHNNILKYQPNRAYSDIDEMNESYIQKWNDKVPNNATVFHLGDFGWWRNLKMAEAFICRLNGNIHLIQGNHDHSKFIKKCGHLFSSISQIKNVNVIDQSCETGLQMVVMSHFPMLVWDRGHYGSWHLHGHSHGSLNDFMPTTRLDVGIDCSPDEAPFSYEEVKSMMSGREYLKLDHH